MCSRRTGFTSGALIWFIAASISCDTANRRFVRGTRAYGSGDYATALKEWTPLAEKGFPQAAHRLALLCAAGAPGVTKDLGQAIRWHRRAAEQGYVPAQYDLGNIYLNDLHDYANAMRWLLLAADKGQADAQFEVGVMHDYGFGVPKNHIEALAWYERAAAQGHANAQWHVGLRYAMGDGVPLDYIAAYKWFNLAAACDLFPAPALDRDRLSKRMTRDQIASGQVASAAWSKSHPNYCAPH